MGLTMRQILYLRKIDLFHILDLKNGGYAPDLYKFLLNDRFFISLGGDILHGSNMENGLEISKKNILKTNFF